MKFTRPVDHRLPILAKFAEKGNRWDQQIDPQTGYWVPRYDGLGDHHGVDFDCPPGTTVRAMVPGVIVKASYESAIDVMSGSGLHIIQLIMMPGFDAWWAKYTHLSTVCVVLGQKVQRGETIGESGYNELRQPYLHIDLMDPKHQYHPPQWEI